MLNKKSLLILALIFLPISVYAGVAILGGGTPIAGCDDCSGTLGYSHHAENNDDATTSANGTCGCSDSVTYKSWTKTSAVYDNTAGYFYDGAYSLKMNGYGHRAVIDNTGNWIDLSATGSVSFWYRGNGTNDSYIFGAGIDSTHFVSLYYYYATGYVRIGVNDGSASVSKTSTVAVPAGGGMIYAGWDAETNLVQIKIGAGAWETNTATAWVDIGTVVSYSLGNYWGGASWSSSYGWIDNVKLYTTKDCT